MKKLALILSVFMLFVCFASCSNSDECSEKMDRGIEFLQANGFSESQEYTREQIVSIEVSFKTTPAHKLDYSILRINHLIKPNSSNGTFDYVYIYLFENSDDAMSIYSSYASLSEYAKISDRVLVFGNSEIINQLEM